MPESAGRVPIAEFLRKISERVSVEAPPTTARFAPPAVEPWVRTRTVSPDEGATGDREEIRVRYSSQKFAIIKGGHVRVSQG